MSFRIQKWSQTQRSFKDLKVILEILQDSIENYLDPRVLSEVFQIQKQSLRSFKDLKVLSEDLQDSKVLKEIYWDPKVLSEIFWALKILSVVFQGLKRILRGLLRSQNYSAVSFKDFKKSEKSFRIQNLSQRSF